MFREAQAAARRASHPQRAEEADRRAKDVELRLTRLAIIVARPPPGLVVALDDNPVTALLGSGIPVDPGSHVIQSSAPGYQSATRRISVEPTPGTLEVRLAELRPLPPSESIARPSRRRRHMTPVAWGLAIGGGAALAAGAIFDATAYADYRGCRDAGGCATDDQVDGIRNRLIAGDLLLGLGLATIGAAAVVYWRSGGPEPSGARVGASLDRGQATVLVQGRF
jgi:hypothetical protein